MQESTPLQIMFACFCAKYGLQTKCSRYAYAFQDEDSDYCKNLS